MQAAAEVKFVGEDGAYGKGELVNPFQYDGNTVFVERNVDSNTVDVMYQTKDGEFRSRRIEIERIVSVKVSV